MFTQILWRIVGQSCKVWTNLDCSLPPPPLSYKVTLEASNSWRRKVERGSPKVAEAAVKPNSKDLLEFVSPKTKLDRNASCHVDPLVWALLVLPPPILSSPMFGRSEYVASQGKGGGPAWIFLPLVGTCRGLKRLEPLGTAVGGFQLGKLSFTSASRRKQKASSAGLPFPFACCAGFLFVGSLFPSQSGAFQNGGTVEQRILPPEVSAISLPRQLGVGRGERDSCLLRIWFLCSRASSAAVFIRHLLALHVATSLCPKSCV